MGRTRLQTTGFSIVSERGFEMFSMHPLKLNAQFSESMVGKCIPRTWPKISSKCFCENKHKNIAKPPIKLMDVDLKDTLTHSSNKYSWLKF